MQRLRFLTLTSFAVLSACTPPDAALKVNVTVRAMGTSRVRADCVRLTISNDTQELKSLTIKRPADDDAVFAVRRGSDLPATVKVQASGFIGTDCSDDSTLKLNAQGEVVSADFPSSGVTEVAVFVDPPNTSLDADRDGFVSAARGGLDCKDDDNTVFPNAGQICANTGDTDCDGQNGCDDSECGSATVCLDPPDRVQITTSVATMLRYECRGPFRVELRNANGPRLAIRDTAVTLSASLAGVTVHGVATCTDAPLTSQPIPFGQSNFEVYLKADGMAFGNTTLEATAAQVATPGRAMVEVHPQPIDHIEFTSPARTVTAGSCSTEQVTLEFRDVMNRRTDVDAQTTVTLASAPGTGDIFFTDAACATPGSTTMLQPGQGTVAVHLKAVTAGTATLTATPSPSPPGALRTQLLTVQPAAATKLAFTNGPIVLSTTQMCSAGLFTVQLQDQFDNPVAASAAVPVRVSVTGLMGVLLFDTSTMCSAAAQTDFSIPAGADSVSFRARGMTAPPNLGDITVRVANGAAITDATQVLRISAGFASKFEFSGGAQSPLANVCSANPFTVSLLDAANNAASSATNQTIALTTQPAPDMSFGFYGGAGCTAPLPATGITIPAGQTSAQFYFRGNRAVAAFEIRGSSGTLSPPPTFLPGNSIRAAAPARLVFTAPATQTAAAGTCTPGPYVANLLDLFDNPTSFTTPQTVTVTSNPTGLPGGSLTVGATTCNVGNTVPLAAGANQVSFNAQHTVTNANYLLTAAVGGFSTLTPVTLNVTPGPSTLQTDIPTGGTVNLIAGVCQQVTLARRDMFNNAAPTTSAVALAFPASTLWDVYTSANCSTGLGAPISMTNASTVTFSVRPRTSGTHVMTASILAMSQQALVTFVVAPFTPTLVFEVPATFVGTATASQTAGTGCTLVTVLRRDLPYLNDVPLGGSGGNLTFTLAPGTTAHTGTPCTTGNATTSIPLTATDARASFYVRATRSSPTGGPATQLVTPALAAQSANLTLTVNPGLPALSIVLPVGGMTTVAANQCQRVNVERRDPNNNLVPIAGAMNLTVTPTANLEIFSSTDCTGPAITNVPVTSGSSTRDFSIRSTLANPAARGLTVTLDGQNAPLSLTVTPGPTTQFNVLGLPATLVSGACAGPITLRRRDQWNNDTSSGLISVAMSSTQFQFSNAADCSSATTGLAVGIADTQAVSNQFYATATLAGLSTMLATLGTATGSGSLTVVADVPSQLAFTTPVRTFIASTCAGAGNVITAQLRDAADNPATAGVGGVTVTAASTSGAGSWFSNNTCATPAPGGVFTIPQGSGSVSMFYRDTAAGTPTVSLTNGSGLANPASQVHTVTVGPPARLVFTTPARTFTAAQCGGAANVITVQLQDLAGNPVNAGGAGQSFTAASSSAGPVAWFVEDTCSVASATGNFTIPNGSNSVNIFYRDNRAGSPSISLTNLTGLMNPTPQVQTVNVGAPAVLAFTSTAQTVPALGCSALTTVTLQDAGGNAVNAGMNRDVTFSVAPAPPNVTFYSNAGCTTALTADMVTMAAGSSTVTMYFKGENAGSVTLTADTPTITPATQPATIGAATPTQLVFTTGPTTVEAGFCLPVTVERQDALNRATSPSSATTITPSFSPVSGASLFSNATCTTALGATFPIAAATSSTTVYVKGISGGITSTTIPTNQLYTLTATSTPLTADTLGITVQPMVRRKNAACTFAANASTATCAITPTLADITRTMLFYQATPDNGDNPAEDNATCRLDPNGGVAQVVCTRVASGGAAAVPIEWQTLSFAYSFANGGVSVQHLSGGCTTAQANAMPLDVTIPTAVTLGQSFVLFSSRTDGADNDGEDFFTARLAGTGTLRFAQSDPSTSCVRGVDFEAQVVSWAGSAVVRGVQTGGTGASFTAAQNTSGPTFLLYSSRMTGDTAGGNDTICRRRLRGEITNGTTLTFTRGCTGADIQDIAWEVVRLPVTSPVSSVQQVTASTTSGQTSVAVTPFTAVDLTRSVAFIGGQGPGGTATGSTTYTATDRVGAAMARAVLTSTTGLTFTRDSNDLIGSFTGYVVQVTP
ncbi:MAG: hypothetical protein Q8L48_13690 [Archangium sp.]|nr:hypothetical protein [Archangium sp.]